MHQVLDALESTVEKSAIADFRGFAQRFHDVPKWIMASDYCFDDRGKANDVATFVLYPYIMDIHQWKECITKMQRTDLKHCRKISPAFCAFAHGGWCFSFSFVIAKDSWLRRWEDPEAQEKLVDEEIKIVERWEEAEEDPHRYDDLLQRLRHLRESMRKKSFHRRLLARILYVTLFAAYLRMLLLREVEHVELFSWLSDRGKLMSFENSVYEVLYEIVAHNLAMEKLPEEKHLQVKDLLPEDDEIGKQIFYDEFVRVADFICGALAEYDMTTGKVHKPKHCTMVEDVLADNPNLVVLHMGKDKVSRVRYQKKDDVDR